MYHTHGVTVIDTNMLFSQQNNVLQIQNNETWTALLTWIAISRD